METSTFFQQVESVLSQYFNRDQILALRAETSSTRIWLETQPEPRCSIFVTLANHHSIAISTPKQTDSMNELVLKCEKLSFKKQVPQAA